jgi:AcrR family transcriptional regulator
MPRDRNRELRRTHRHEGRQHRHQRSDRDTRRAERRTELLDAAVAVIRRDGPGVSMEAIAAEAGVTKPIVYRHFGDRHGLVAALAERFSDGLLAELRASLTQTDPRQVLAGTIEAYLAFVERDPNVYLFLSQRIPGDAETAGQLHGFIRQIAGEIAVELGERLRAAGVDSGPAEPWAYGLVGMVQLAGDWWIERRSLPRARLVEYLTNLVWDGLSGVTSVEVEG